MLNRSVVRAWFLARNQHLIQQHRRLKKVLGPIFLCFLRHDKYLVPLYLVNCKTERNKHHIKIKHFLTNLRFFIMGKKFVPRHEHCKEESGVTCTCVCQVTALPLPVNAVSIFFSYSLLYMALCMVRNAHLH